MSPERSSTSGRGNVPLKAGDVLFRIDPAPYEAQVEAIEAQLKLAATRLAQMTQLHERDSGRASTSSSGSRSRSAQGPARGREMESRQDHRTGAGRRLCHQPRAAQGRARHQSAAVAGDGVHRYLGYHHRRRDRTDRRALCRAGQAVEVTFKFLPGQVFTGKVESVLQAIATGQVQTSGLAVHAKGCVRAVRGRDQARRRRCRRRAGRSTGTAAIFTDHVKAAHIIRKVLLRQIAIRTTSTRFDRTEERRGPEYGEQNNGVQINPQTPGERSSGPARLQDIGDRAVRRHVLIIGLTLVYLSFSRITAIADYGGEQVHRQGGGVVRRIELVRS